MGKLHYFTLLLLIILLAVASGWVFQSIDKKTIATEKVVRHDPDYFLENFTATKMNKKGLPAYKVKSVHLEHYPDDDSMKLISPVFSFYENNIKSWTAEADEAIILQKNQTVHLSGHVVLTQVPQQNKKSQSPPMVLTANQLTIEIERKIARTKSKVKLTQGKNHIEAVGMRADMSKNRIEFLSRTRSHYVLPAK